ncbi:MAG: beta-xylosidase [Akkermansiaceae bacterium]|nr:beta-xylosidase [Verrucomicrobiales bacterium]
MSIELKANAGDAGQPLKHFWSLCVGAGRANEGLRADWQEQLRLAVKECGFKYIRFHGLYHDDMFVYREENGRGIYNFQYVDILFDKLLAIGIKPFVEFGFCPRDLAAETGTVFWWKGNGSPPKDFAKWGELIRRTMQNWIERYGIEEVRTWYFEVWNEPNLHPFFRGTKSQYFELYKTTALVLKELDPHLRVGGPATSNFVPDGRFDGEVEDTACHRVVTQAADINALDWQPVWVKQFLAFCEREKLPVDFVSVHPYPTDWALDEHTPGEFKKNTREVGATPRDLALVKAMVGASAFPRAEIHCTEWSSSSSPRDFTHDFLQAATFVTKANLEGAGCVDSLSYWTFTDVFEESGAGDTVFHGGFGMINLQGIVKPTFHAYRFMNALGDEVLGRFPAGVVTRCSQTGKLSAIAYHYPPEMPQTVLASFDSRAKAYETLALGRPEALSIELAGLKPGAMVLVETLDKQNGNALAAWEALGKPDKLTREQTKLLREQAAATRKEKFTADAGGGFKLQRSIEPWSVVLIREL